MIAELQPCPHPDWTPGTPCLCGACPTPTGDEPDCALCVDLPDDECRPGSATVNDLPLCWVHWTAWNAESGDTPDRVMDAIDARTTDEEATP